MKKKTESTRITRKTRYLGCKIGITLHKKQVKKNL
jgi:hypothetical protein